MEREDVALEEVIIHQRVEEWPRAVEGEGGRCEANDAGEGIVAKRETALLRHLDKCLPVHRQAVARHSVVREPPGHLASAKSDEDLAASAVVVSITCRCA